MMLFGSMKNGQQGTTLISTMIAVSTLAIVASAFTKMFSSSLKTQAHVDLKNEREVVRMHILRNLSCEHTFSPFSHPAKCKNLPLALRDKNGKIFVEKKGKSFGKWHVSAQCSSSEIVFFVTSRIGKKYRKDPLTQTFYDRNHPKASLFPLGLSPCQLATTPSRYAQGYRDFQKPGAPIVMFEGPSSAIKPIDNGKNVNGDSGRFGVVCNKSEGWNVMGCYSGAPGKDNDVDPYPNGCVTNDSGSQMAISCIRL